MQSESQPSADGLTRAEQRPRVKRPFRLKLGLLLGAVAALAIVVPAAIQAFFQVRDVRERVAAENLAIARSTAKEVGELVTLTGRGLAMAATDPEFITDTLDGRTARLEARLEAMAPADPDLLALAVIDLHGRLRASSARDPTLLRIYLANEHHVQTALNGGVSSTGAARMGANTGLPSVPIGVPIQVRNGPVVGVLEGSLSLERLSERLARIDVGEGGYVSLLQGDGTILTDPDSTRILSSDAGTNPAVALALRGQPAVAETVNPAGVPVVVAAAPVDKLGWVVQAQLPVDEAFAPLREDLTRAALTAIGAFLAALLFGSLAAQGLTAPITALSAATRRLASGDYDTPVPKVRTQDELEELAHDFGVMAGSLRQTMGSLEARAEELSGLYAAAERQRALARAVLDGIKEAIVFVGPDGRLALANDRLAALMGLEPEQVVGRDLDELTDDFSRVFEHPETVDGLIREPRADSERVLNEVVRTRWPASLELALFSTPVQARDGELLGRLYVFRDVTHEREVDRMKSEFVSLVSHELRTPLTSIKGYVDLLLDGDAGELDEEVEEYLGIVKSNADRLVALINDLLDISRIESGRIQLRRETLDLSRLITQTAQSLRPQIEAKEQRLAVDLAEPLPAVVGDPDRITQVLTNLLSNAYKYTPAGGSIDVSARTEAGRVRIAVKDSGIGLTPEELEQLFTKFFRADNETTRAVGGTGLGLSITRSLVEMHGGTMAVSSAPGDGSTFSFTLPTVPAPSVAEAPPIGVAPGGRVLVIDDEPDIAGLIRRYLERAGYETLTAQTATDGLRLARETRPDLITLDVAMPDADGFTLLEWLKGDSTTARIPVVLLSIMPDDEGRGTLLGAIDYLTKPVNERVLVERISQILDGERPRRVLVAEDDADVRALIAGQLRRAGYEALEAEDGEQAVALALQERPGLVLMDIRMPRMDGLAALKALRAEPETRELPVVVMTASQSLLEESRSTVEALGGAVLLSKPCTAEELAQAISRGMAVEAATQRR